MVRYERADLPVELLEKRHVKAALSSHAGEDGSQLAGLAQLMRLGWFRPVTASRWPPSRCAPCSPRKVGAVKLYDIEMSLLGILRGFGLKVGPTTSQSFAARINHLVTGRRVWKR